MASIEKRRTKDRRTRYRVRWLLGGHRGGASQSETLDTRPEALTFKLAVEAAGHLWPDNWIRGVGWAPEPEPEPEDEGAEPALAPILFGNYAINYARTLTGVDERTRHDYERDIRNHMLATFGELDIRDGQALDRTVVRRWVNMLQTGIPDRDRPTQWLKRPLRPKTIANLHGLLYSILQDAVEADPPLRASNPAARTKLPRLDDGEGDEEMVFLTEQEFVLLRSCAKEDVRDMLTVFVGTGLRYSELVALQARDVDLDATPRPTLRVRRAWKRRGDNTFYLGPPKTKTSRRTIGLNSDVVAALRPNLEGKAPKDLVFTAPRGGWWRHASFYDRRWLPALAEAAKRGLTKRPRIHDLRHTHVSWLIAEGCSLPGIQKRMGHQSITTTFNRYGHLLPRVDDELVDALDRAFARGRALTAPQQPQTVHHRVQTRPCSGRRPAHRPGHRARA